MKVLIACEYSGTVREEFKKLGHDAWSCDILDTEIPGNHFKGDVLEHLNKDCEICDYINDYICFDCENIQVKEKYPNAKWDLPEWILESKK